MSIKQLFVTLIILLFTYFMLANFIFKEKEKTSLEYELSENNLKIKEKHLKKNIYYEISDENNVFAFKIDKVSGNYLIKNVLYKKIDDYTCIYPKFKNDSTVDVICNKDGVLYPYKSIQGINSNIDAFVKSIDDYELSETVIGENVKKDSITIYKDNIASNAYIAIENYKGLYLINKKDVLKNIELFSKDIYKKELSTFFKNKYLVADYNKNYTFHEFYIIDIKTGKKITIARDEKMNFDAYVMGTIDNKIYILDKDSKEQYAINLKNNTFNKTGDSKTGINYYVNNEFKKITALEAIEKNKKFNLYNFEDEMFKYDRVDLINDNYYIYEKENDGYLVYQIYVENKNIKTFLFKTTDIEDIVYIKDDIYFINGNKINYYNKKIGIKTIIQNKELEYNKNLKFNVFYS